MTNSAKPNGEDLMVKTSWPRFYAPNPCGQEVRHGGQDLLGKSLQGRYFGTKTLYEIPYSILFSADFVGADFVGADLTYRPYRPRDLL